MQTSPEITGSTGTRPYSIQRLCSENLHDLARLHAAVYGIVNTDYVKKYDTAYTGAQYVGFIAYNHNGLAVAYYGVIPCLLVYDQKEMLAAQSADTMTHPDYRLKGIFAELSHLTFDLCKQLGIRLIFGFPNQNFYRAAVTKLNWSESEQMAGFAIPVHSLPLASLAKKAGIYHSLYRRYTDLILGKGQLVPGVASSVLHDGFAGVHRTDEYIAYKTYSSSREITLAGVQLWITDKHGLMIGDALGLDENNFMPVINQIKKIAAKLGIRQIQFHSSPGTSLHRLFAAHYTSFPSFPVVFQDFGSFIPPEKIKFTFADIDIF